MKKSIMMFILISTRLLSSSDDRYDLYYSADEHELKSARQEYDLAREELDRLVVRNIDEVSCHAVLRLLATELQLVDKLLHSQTGAVLDELLTKKKKLLESSTKTASCLYKAVMKFATNDILITGENGVSRLGSTLRDLDKRSYLRRMKKILAEYRNDFLDKQYETLKRTLGLPVARYAPYATQEPQDINVDMMPVGKAQPLFNYEPQWCYKDRYGDKAITAESFFDCDITTIDSFDKLSADAKFSSLWDDCMAQVHHKDIAQLMDDVLALVKHEMQSHLGSLSERNKMLYGASEGDNFAENDLVQALSQVSVRARALFSTLREAATENTMRLGCWNPDVYERYLDKYAERLECVRAQPQNAVSVASQDLCNKSENGKGSMQRLISNFVYNIVPSH